MKNTSDKKIIRSSTAEFLIFTAQSGEDSIEVRYQGETIWVTQKMMGVLYDVDVRTINYHLKKVFSDSELQEN